MNTPDIEETLRAAYIAAGGTDAGFAADRGELLSQFRKQAAVTAALGAAQRKPTVSDYLREQRDADRAGTDEILARFVNQEGASR